ncbi:hypothetical protein HJFPF1_02291 [Paramyrothecium foliicola]|nr:hypothetical protein HJFPF1_02291 [Paramyrothecium foliicola]
MSVKMRATSIQLGMCYLSQTQRQQLPRPSNQEMVALEYAFHYATQSVSYDDNGDDVDGPDMASLTRISIRTLSLLGVRYILELLVLSKSLYRIP